MDAQNCVVEKDQLLEDRRASLEAAEKQLEGQLSLSDSAHTVTDLRSDLEDFCVARSADSSQQQCSYVDQAPAMLPCGVEDVSARLRLAEECATKAGELMLASMRDRELNHRGISFRTKASVVDPVTEVDEAAERLIVAMIGASFPGDTVISEEGYNEQVDEQLSRPGFAWVIDPIDGTRNFLHCLPNTSVSIGLVFNGQIVGGVVHAPVFGETYAARLGAGATLNGKQIRVSAVRALEHAAVATDINSREQPLLDDTLAQWRALLLANVQNLRVRGSAALELCSVACGRLDAHFEGGLDVWDVCAAALIIREAGGVCLDEQAGDLQLRGFKGYVLATNSPELATRLQQSMAGACLRRNTSAVGPGWGMAAAAFAAGVAAAIFVVKLRGSEGR